MINISYKYVLAVANYRNMRKAAASLCITQPALTKYINRLEEDLGVRLFNRSTTPITLTESGRRFIEAASTISNLEDALLNDIKKQELTLKGSFTCGLTPEFSAQVLPYILPTFKQRHPNVELHFIEEHNEKLIQLLKEEKIELAIVTSYYQDSEICTETFMEDPIILAVPYSHPLCKTINLTANSPLTPYYLESSNIRHENFIVCPTQLGIGAVAAAMFQRHKLFPNIVLEISRNETAVKIASAGVGMVFCPVKTPLRMQLIQPMAYFSLDNPLYIRKRCYCYLKKMPLSMQATYFIELLNQVIHTDSIFSIPSCQLMFCK